MLLVALGGWGTFCWSQGLRLAAASFRWPTSTCTIHASSVVGDVPFEARVRYRYGVGGTVYDGERIHAGYVGSDQRGDALRTIAPYPPGAEVECWVDPEDPTWSALELYPWRSRLPEGVLFAGMLVVGLFRMGWLQLEALAARRLANLAASTGDRGEPVSRVLPRSLEAVRTGSPWLALLLFCAAILWMGTRPIASVLERLGAGNWQEIPCTIEEIGIDSRLSSHTTGIRLSSSPTYSVAVLFSYQLDGRTYRSSRFDFSREGDGDEDDKLAAVARHPAGRSTCWVDPSQPTRAVVERRLGIHGFGLAVALPLLGLIAGGGCVGAAVGLWGALRRA
jgi:hypothetical protein